MEVKSGFKYTENGIIPSPWQVLKIKDFTDCTSGGTPSTSIRSYWGGTIPWMSSGELNFKIVSDVKGRITEEGLKNSSTKIIPQNCVLIGLAGQGKTRGTVAVNMIELCTNQSIAAIFPNSKFSYKYLFYSLESRYKELRELSAGDGGRGGLNLTLIKNLNVIFPELPEQEAIAKALTDVDALIESLEKLIEKKRQIKQGAMQELLTGKKRLSGFSGEWEIHLLKSITWYQEGPGVRNWQFTSSGIKLLNGTNIVNGVLNLDSTSRFISEQEAYGAYAHFMAEEGDIVIASSGITVDKFDQKVAFVKAENLPFCMNTSTIRFKTYPKINANFLYHYLKSSDFKQQIGGQATGSAQLNFGPSHLDKITIQLPKVDEQIAIADVLTDLDSELTELDLKLNKARQIKQGMMQELLTGRIRLV